MQPRLIEMVIIAVKVVDGLMSIRVSNITTRVIPRGRFCLIHVANEGLRVRFLQISFDVVLA